MDESTIGLIEIIRRRVEKRAAEIDRLLDYPAWQIWRINRLIKVGRLLKEQTIDLDLWEMLDELRRQQSAHIYNAAE